MNSLTTEHYVAECTLKCAQVVLASRVPRSKSAAIAPVDKRSGRWVRGVVGRMRICAVGEDGGRGTGWFSPGQRGKTVARIAHRNNPPHCCRR